MGMIAAVLWFVLPVTFGCAAAAHGQSFWLGFLLAALANGVLRFLWRPFGMLGRSYNRLGLNHP